MRVCLLTYSRCHGGSALSWLGCCFDPESLHKPCCHSSWLHYLSHIKELAEAFKKSFSRFVAIMQQVCRWWRVVGKLHWIDDLTGQSTAQSRQQKENHAVVKMWINIHQKYMWTYSSTPDTHLSCKWLYIQYISRFCVFAVIVHAWVQDACGLF